MLLAAAALVMTPLWARPAPQSLGRGPGRGPLRAGDARATAPASSGSSRWPLLAAYRGLPSWRWIGVAVAVGIVLMAPWSAYQKYGDPPGNRLTKWTLAGVAEIDDRGAVETILDAYGEAGLGGTLHNKAENFVDHDSGGTMAPNRSGRVVSDGTLTEIARTIRAIDFFYLLPSLGLLLLAPLLMAGGGGAGGGATRPSGPSRSPASRSSRSAPFVWGADRASATAPPDRAPLRQLPAAAAGVRRRRRRPARRLPALRPLLRRLRSPLLSLASMRRRWTRRRAAPTAAGDRRSRAAGARPASSPGAPATTGRGSCGRLAPGPTR